MPNNQDNVKEKVEAEFQSMEAALAASSPGIMDVLRVYGAYEAAVRQTDAYLALLSPRPAYYTSDRSTP
jgi:hypothetical protein